MKMESIEIKSALQKKIYEIKKKKKEAKLLRKKYKGETKERLKMLNRIARSEPIATFIKKVKPLTVAYIGDYPFSTRNIVLSRRWGKIGVYFAYGACFHNIGNEYYANQGLHRIVLNEWETPLLEQLSRINKEEILEKIKIECQVKSYLEYEIERGI